MVACLVRTRADAPPGSRHSVRTQRDRCTSRAVSAQPRYAGTFHAMMGVFAVLLRVEACVGTLLIRDCRTCVVSVPGVVHVDANTEQQSHTTFWADEGTTWVFV